MVALYPVPSGELGIDVLIVTMARKMARAIVMAVSYCIRPHLIAILQLVSEFLYLQHLRLT